METPAPSYDTVGPILDGIARVPGLLFESMQLNPGPWLITGAIFAGVIVLKVIEFRITGRRRGRRG